MTIEGIGYAKKPVVSRMRPFQSGQPHPVTIQQPFQPLAARQADGIEQLKQAALAREQEITRIRRLRKAGYPFIGPAWFTSFQPHSDRRFADTHTHQ